VILGAGPTGAELALEARRQRPDLAVLLTSGYERPAAASDEQPGTEFALLRKPYRREELATALRAALER
jgi:DNA-binding NtrC family response regulator